MVDQIKKLVETTEKMLIQMKQADEIIKKQQVIIEEQQSEMTALKIELIKYKTYATEHGYSDSYKLN